MNAPKEARSVSMRDWVAPARPVSRRSFLRAGASATVLGLAATRLRGVAEAAGVGRPRFVFIYTPSGRDPSWRTGTPGPDYKLGPTMAMFEPYRSKTALLDGFTIVNFGYHINAHWGALHCLLGGKPPLVRPGNSGGALSEGSQRTFDHLLADRIGKQDPVKNIVLGGLDRDNDNGSLLASWSGPKQAVLPIHDPDKAFSALFNGATTPAATGEQTAEARLRARSFRTDILGLSRDQLGLFKRSLGKQEQVALESYESNLAETLQRVSTESTDVAADLAMCRNVGLAGLSAGLPTASFERQHDLQSRVLAAALACGRTSVATYVMGGLRSSLTVPGGRGGHHLHDDGAVGHYRAFDVYYGNRVKALMDELAKYPEGDGTVLDHTVIVWSSDIAWTPVEHDHDNHPIYVFGGVPGGKLKLGQYVKVGFDASGSRENRLANPKNRRLHEVLLTIAAAMGITDLDGFADPRYVQGPVAELLR